MSKIITALIFCLTTPLLSLTIMLDPGGHHNQRGRKLTHGYERGATLHMAEGLQKKLAPHKDLTVLLTRLAGEYTKRIDVVSYANQLQVNLFISIHIYKTTSPKPIIHLFYRSTDAINKEIPTKYNRLQFVPIHKAHQASLPTTKKLAHSLATLLSQPSYAKICEVDGPYGIPLKSLNGLIVPAISLEIGIQDEQQTSIIYPYLASAIAELREKFSPFE